MMAELPAASTVWVIDASALQAEEINAVRKLPQHYFVYEHLDNPQHEQMGPLLVADCEAVLELISPIQEDASRSWCLSKWTSDQPWDRLTEHARQLRHIKTGDGQRFYLRFADARSFASVWAVLSPHQQSRVLAPLQSWEYLDRQGQAVVLRARPEALTQPSALALHLNDQQLTHLLDLIWPDQLLAGWLEDNPSLMGQILLPRAYQLSQEACSWFKEANEERFDVQKELLGRLVQSEIEPGDRVSVRSLLKEHHG